LYQSVKTSLFSCKSENITLILCIVSTSVMQTRMKQRANILKMWNL